MNDNNETNNATATAGLFSPAPETAYERAVADYLTANASDALRDKIAEAQKSGKGIKECYAYITGQARKEAQGKTSVMISDAVVYGWAVHYFEDEWRDELEREAKAKELREKNAREAAERAAQRKAQALKTEAERVAAMSDKERATYERAKAEREAAEAKRKAEAEAKEAERKEREEKRKAKEQAKAKAEERKRVFAAAQMSFNF